MGWVISDARENVTIRHQSIQTRDVQVMEGGVESGGIVDHIFCSTRTRLFNDTMFRLEGKLSA